MDSSTSKGLSSGIVIGLTMVLVLAAALAVFVALLFVQRRRRAEFEKNLPFVQTKSTLDSSVDLEKSDVLLAPAGTGHADKLASPYASMSSMDRTPALFSNCPLVPPKSLLVSTTASRGDSHLSVEISPAARSGHSKPQVNIPPNTLRPPVPSIRRLSSQEIIGQHKADGTMPRRFAPLADTSGNVTDRSQTASPRKATARISRSSIISNRRRSSLYFSTSASEGELNVDPSLSSLSVASLPSSASPSLPLPYPQPNVRKVRSIFTPLLPDELVLRPNERLTLIKSCSDGWCIVGRKSPFYVPFSVRKEFGQRSAGRSDEIEIGAVPAWIFESGGKNAPGERPPRKESLIVVITMGDYDDDRKDGRNRDNAVNWSNAY